MNKNIDSDSTKKHNTSTERAKLFREKLASENLRRFEIFISDETRNQIKEIAKKENIPSGIAAQSLLSMGVDAYQKTTELNKVVVQSVMQNQINLITRSMKDKGLASLDSLSSYSSRSDDRSLQNHPNEYSQNEKSNNSRQQNSSSVISSFFDKVKAKKLKE